MALREFWRRNALWLAPLLIFTTAGVLEAVHGYIGYTLSGRPQFGYTLRGQPMTFPGLLARSLISWVVLGITAGIALRLTRHRPLVSREWRSSLAFHLPAAVLFSVVFLLTAAALRHFMFVGPETGISFGTSLLRYYTVYFNTFFLFYWGVVGVYSAFIHLREVRERELVAERLRRGLTEARLRALKNQLQPHFLFNTLNSISGLALEGDTQGTVRMLRMLGDLLRATLERSQDVVSIAAELELLDLYIEIQRVRFEDRLEVRVRVEPAVMDAEIPAFLLQPLVENAIRHGIMNSPDGGWIEISAQRRGARVSVAVSDSGPGLSAQPVSPGIGLSTCIARLEHLYGTSHSFAIENAAHGGARVTLEWPLRAAGTAAVGGADADQRPHLLSVGAGASG